MSIVNETSMVVFNSTLHVSSILYISNQLSPKCPGGKCPGGKCPGGICPGGTCPGGLCPRTIL